MALFVLHRIPTNAPVHNAYYGFVIRANNAMRARLIAADHAKEEGPETWKDNTRSTCKALSEVGNERVILADFNAP